jgi:hypothetical protein
MPDMDAFFAVVARLLRPQGHLLIYEMHPFTTMFDLPEETDKPLQVALSYFNRSATEDKNGLDYYTGAAYDAHPNYWFTHTLSTIFNAMIANRIAIIGFDEYAHDISAVFGPLEPYHLMPLSCILVGQRLT